MAQMQVPSPRFRGWTAVPLIRKSAVRSGADGDGPVFDPTIPAEGWQAALLDSARRGEHILRFGDDYTACVQRRSAM